MRRNYNPETLPKYKYPNLVAEFMETGYSICTLSEHMGLGRRQENDPLINAKLFGDEKIMSDEAIGLARLFGCEIRYLFAAQKWAVSLYTEKLEGRRFYNGECEDRGVERV